MGPKRGQVVQLQAEINTEAELQEWLEHNQGLGIIDVYSEWCGPCVSMIPYLRKIKIEKDESLVFAIAKSDTVDSLHRFVGRSEPTWLFVAKGKTVRLFKGVNYPRFEEAVLEEIEKHAQANAGHDSRTYIHISTLTSEEQIVADAIEAEEKLQADLTKQEELRKIEERRVEVGLAVAAGCINLTVLIIWPKFVNNIKTMSYLRNRIEEKSFDVEKRKTWQLDFDLIEEFRKFAGYDLSDLATDSLLDGKAGIWLVTSKGNITEENPVEKAFLELLHVEFEKPPVDGPKNIFDSFVHTVLYPVEGETEEEESENESETEAEHQRAFSSAASSMAEIETHGEKCPGLWTPNEPIPLARATVLLTLFSDYVTPFIPPLFSPIPPHVAFIFPASQNKKIIKAIKANNMEDEILNYGFFSSDNPINRRTIANSCLNYHHIKTHLPDEVFVLAVSQKRSFPSITLAELEPKYISDNPKEGEADCGIWFGPDWIQGTEKVEMEEEEEGLEEEEIELEEETEEELNL